MMILWNSIRTRSRTAIRGFFSFSRSSGDVVPEHDAYAFSTIENDPTGALSDINASGYASSEIATNVGAMSPINDREYGALSTISPNTTGTASDI